MFGVLHHVKNLDAIKCVCQSFGFDGKDDRHFAIRLGNSDVNRVQLCLSYSGNTFANM